MYTRDQEAMNPGEEAPDPCRTPETPNRSDLSFRGQSLIDTGLTHTSGLPERAHLRALYGVQRFLRTRLLGAARELVRVSRHRTRWAVLLTGKIYYSRAFDPLDEIRSVFSTFAFP
ncbi:hypothetical protein ACWGMA_36805 [Streptomyces asiaticus]